MYQLFLQLRCYPLEQHKEVGVVFVFGFPYHRFSQTGLAHLSEVLGCIPVKDQTQIEIDVAEESNNLHFLATCLIHHTGLLFVLRNRLVSCVL